MGGGVLVDEALLDGRQGLALLTDETMEGLELGGFLGMDDRRRRAEAERGRDNGRLLLFWGLNGFDIYGHCPTPAIIVACVFEFHRCSACVKSKALLRT